MIKMFIIENGRFLADAYQSRKEFERCEHAYKYASDIVQSNFFTSLSEEEKARLNADLASLGEDRQKAKQVSEEALAKIIEKGSWPVAPPPIDPLQQEEKEKHLEIVHYVQELADTVLKIKQVLGDISQMASPPTLPVPVVVEDDIYEEDAMNVDDGSTSDAPQSRGGDNTDGTTGVAAPGATLHDPNLPTREELDELLKRLEIIETKASDLTNEIDQHQNDVAQTFENEAEKVVENYGAERQRKDDEEREGEKKRVDAEVDRVNKESEALGKDVEFLGGEVVGLIQKIEKLQFEVEQEKKDRDIRWSTISQVRVFIFSYQLFVILIFLFLIQFEERLKGFQQSRETNQRAIQTLEAALKVYQSSALQPSPPQTPGSNAATPTLSYILSELQDPITEIVRETIRPMLDQTRSETLNLVKQKNREVVERVWLRIELVLKVLATLADKVDKERSAASATVPPLQVSGSVQQQLPLVEIAIQGRGQAEPSLSGWVPR